ncbi:MAG: hypothetical protein WDN31_09155, partial [Hyphomicrobium sp.]
RRDTCGSSMLPRTIMSQLINAVEKAFSRQRTKVLKTADAFRAATRGTISFCTKATTGLRIGR